MARTSSYRVLGIDPGLNITGYGCIERGRGDPSIVEAGAIRTKPKADTPTRITQIHADLVEIIEELQPDLVSVEKLYAHYAHPRTAIIMGHARGVVLLAAQQAGVGIKDVAATEVKKSLTGNGHATKLQVQRAIQAVFKLTEMPQPADVADALAIALCALNRV